MGLFVHEHGIKVWLLPFVILFSAKKVTARDYLSESKDALSKPAISRHLSFLNEQEQTEEIEEDEGSHTSLSIPPGSGDLPATPDSPEMECPLKVLPHELLLHITSFMKIKDALHFYMTCKAFWPLRNDALSWKQRIRMPQWFADIEMKEVKPKVFLPPLKKRLLQQEMIFTLKKALKINVNRGKRAHVLIQSSLPCDHLFGLLTRIPPRFFQENGKFRWLRWIATAPVLAHSIDASELEKLSEWMNFKENEQTKKFKNLRARLIHHWKDQVEGLVGLHPLASFTFALLNQTFPKNAPLTFAIHFGDKPEACAQLNIPTWFDCNGKPELVNQAFQEAVNANVPTAAYEYAQFLKPSIDDFDDEKELYEKMIGKAANENNWSGDLAKKVRLI